VSARQIQRVVQRVGTAAQRWQERRAIPGLPDGETPIMYISADGTGVPIGAGGTGRRKGKQPDGKAQNRQYIWDVVYSAPGR